MFLTVIYADSLQRDGRWANELLSSLIRLTPFGKNYFLLLSRRNAWAIPFLNPENIIVIGQVNIAYQLSKSLNNTNVHFVPAECWLSEDEYMAMYPDDIIIYKKMSNIYFWGKKSFRWFSEHRSHCKPDLNLHIIGYPRQQFLDKIKHLNSKNSKNYIGLVGRFSGINDLYHRPPLSLIQSDTTNYSSRRLLVETKIFSYYDHIITTLNASKSISLRPHPNEDRHMYLKTKNYHLDTSIDNIDWFTDVSILVGCLSTSIIDSYFAGIPYICIDKLLGTFDESLALEPALIKAVPFCIFPASETELHCLLNENPHNLLKKIIPSPRDVHSLDQSFDPNFLNSAEAAAKINSNLVHSSETSFYSPTYLFRLISILLFRLLDIFHQLLHRYFKPHRLLFDYSNLFHEFK